MHRVDKRLNHDVVFYDHPGTPPPDSLVDHFAALMRPGPGKFTVLMDRPHQPETAVLVAVPWGGFGRYKATVVAAGEGVGLQKGDRVLVRQKWAKQVPNFSVAGRKSWPHELRCYGAQGGRPMDLPYGDPGVALVVDWWEGVGCMVTSEGYRAVGENVVVKLPPLETETRGGIALPEQSQRRSCMAEIVSVGPEARARFPELKEGLRCVFAEGAAKRIVSPDDPEDGSGHASVSADMVHFVLEEDPTD